MGLGRLIGFIDSFIGDVRGDDSGLLVGVEGSGTALIIRIKES